MYAISLREGKKKVDIPTKFNLCGVLFQRCVNLYNVDLLVKIRKNEGELEMGAKTKMNITGFV